MPQDRLCKLCGKIGHTSKKCQEKWKRGKKDKSKEDIEKGRIGRCLNCGDMGHVSCLKNRFHRKSDVICHSCGRPGHMKNQCPHDSRSKDKGRVADAVDFTHFGQVLDRLTLTNNRKSESQPYVLKSQSLPKQPKAVDQNFPTEKTLPRMPVEKSGGFDFQQSK